MKPKPSSRRGSARLDPTRHFTTAKIVLLGESGVGKSALGWCLAGGEYRLHPRNHPMQYWVLCELEPQGNSAAQREIVLWDMASEPDFKTINPLYLGDADLALIVFDPTVRPDPLQVVTYWLNQISAAPATRCKAILVSARADVGAPSITRKDIQDFCTERGILGGYIATSAAQATGLLQLKRRIHSTIDWRNSNKVSVPSDFHAVKNLVLRRRSRGRIASCILSTRQLFNSLKRSGELSTDEPALLDAVRLLAKFGYVRLLGETDAELKVLVDPGLFDALAASFVRQARQHDRGLGALEEDRLLSDRYDFAELRGLSPSNRMILIQAVALAFLENRLTVRCRREAVGATKLLVFPEEVRLKRPVTADGEGIEDGVSYIVTGDTSQLFPILVVSLAYTNNFARFEHWKDRARYEFGDGLVCGFRVEDERENQVDFVLYFGASVGAPVRTFFRGLFESFLGRQEVKVSIYDVVVCSQGHQLHRGIVREHMLDHSPAFCTKCGEPVAIPTSVRRIQLIRGDDANVVAAEKRLLFEKVAFQWKAYVAEKDIPAPDCFISYAWGNSEHERWVDSLASDLSKAGIVVFLDRWENSQIGASVPRFVERVAKCNRVVVVGTRLYKTKYENESPMGPFVLAAEGDLIGKRMIGSEERKRSVLPVLLEGTEESSLPDLLQGRVHADFRNREAYFDTVFNLILSLFRISPRDPVAEELRRTLG